jgi:hypothetical protein
MSGQFLLYKPNAPLRARLAHGNCGRHPLARDIACSSQLTLSAFPNFDRNMNTGHAIGVDAFGLIAEVSVFHDASRPAR